MRFQPRFHNAIQEERPDNITIAVIVDLVVDDTFPDVWGLDMLAKPDNAKELLKDDVSMLKNTESRTEYAVHTLNALSEKFSDEEGTRADEILGLASLHVAKHDVFIQTSLSRPRRATIAVAAAPASAPAPALALAPAPVPALAVALALAPAPAPAFALALALALACAFSCARAIAVAPALALALALARAFASASACAFAPPCPCSCSCSCRCSRS